MNQLRTCHKLAVLLLVLSFMGCALTESYSTFPHRPGLRRLHPQTPQGFGAPDYDLQNDTIAAQLEDEHLINVGDQVEVKFPYKTEFNQIQTVREDGKVALPLLEPVMALGFTPEQLRDEVERRYGTLQYDPLQNRLNAAKRKYLINAGDSLDIKFDFETEYDEQVVVRPDGRISLRRIKSLVAEGKTPEELEQDLMEKYKQFLKDPSLVVITRRIANEVVYVDGQPARLGLKDLDNLAVVVHRQAPRMIYVTGEVNNSGVFPYRAPMTVARALANAGGYKRSAKLASVIILRRVGPRDSVALKVNLLPEFRGNKNTDIPLRPYDVVVVPKTFITQVQDVLDQYLYNLIPATKSATLFNFVMDLNPAAAIISAGATATK